MHDAVKVKGGKGAWWLFINHQGRRKAKRVGPGRRHKKAAEVAAIKLQAGSWRAISRVFEERPAHATLGDYAETWLATHAHQGCKFSTIRIYEVNLRRHVLPVLGAKPLHLLSRADCRTLIAAVATRDCAQEDREHLPYGQQHALASGGGWPTGGEPGDPAGTLLPKSRSPKRPICPLTQQEVRVLLAAAQQHTPREYPCSCSARPDGPAAGGVAGAAMGGSSTSTGAFIEVRRNLVAGRLTTPRTARPRRVDMSDQLLSDAAGAADRAQRGNTAAGLGPGAGVGILQREPGVRLDGDNLRQRVFYKVLEKAGLRRIRIHDLRHTFASLLMQNGENLEYIQEQLGHSSIQVTVDIYGHLIPGANRQAVDRSGRCNQPQPCATNNEKGATA